MANKLYSDTWAYDLHKNIISKGEVYNTDVIDSSIESILSTSYGERFFNPYFGSVLAGLLFEGITVESAETLLDQIIDNIETWEDRITIDRPNSTITIIRDENALIISLPYTINKTAIQSSFERKVYV